MNSHELRAQIEMRSEILLHRIVGTHMSFSIHDEFIVGDKNQHLVERYTVLSVGDDGFVV